MTTPDPAVPDIDEAVVGKGRPTPALVALARLLGRLAAGEWLAAGETAGLPANGRPDIVSADRSRLPVAATGKPGISRHGATEGPAPTALPRLFTVSDTATYAQISEKTVRRWLESGLLPFHRLGRQIRIAEADLLAFIAARRQQ